MQAAMTRRSIIDHPHLLRRIVAALALAAMLLRGIVPLGAMPLSGAPASDGLFPIAICASGFAKTVWVDAQGQPVDPPPGEARDHASSACPFCAFSMGAPALASVPLPRFVITVASTVAPFTAAPARTLAFLPDSHGPPQT